MKLKTIVSVFFLAAALCCTAAEKKVFKFHQLFTDHAVFQQNTE